MRREKSLSILSRKFIQMFLEGKVRELDVCSHMNFVVFSFFQEQKTRAMQLLRGEDVISLETVAKTVLAATAKGMVEDGPKVKSA